MSAAQSPEWMSPEEFQETKQTLELIAFFARTADVEKFLRRLALAELAPATDPSIDAAELPHIKAIAVAAAKFKQEAAPHHGALVEQRAQHHRSRRKLSS